MIETKPRINRGNRGQLFRATWLSSARCSETFRRTTERVECSAKCTWQWPRTGLNLFQILPTSWRDHEQWTKDPKNVAVVLSERFVHAKIRGGGGGHFSIMVYRGVMTKFSFVCFTYHIEISQRTGQSDLFIDWTTCMSNMSSPSATQSFWWSAVFGGRNACITCTYDLA